MDAAQGGAAVVVGGARCCAVFGGVAHPHVVELNGAQRTAHCVCATGLHGGVFNQVQPAFERGQAPCDGPGDFSQVPNGCDQHQHGGDKRHKVAHRHAGLAALPQGHRDHGRQRRGRQHLRQRCHGRHGHGRLQREAAQRHAQVVKALGLALLGAVQAHHAVGECVFFDHVGQLVGGLLAGAGEFVEPPRQHPHDQNQTRKQQQHDQRELPVQVHQITEQGEQREAVLGQGQHGSHQHGGTGLHLVHQGV